MILDMIITKTDDGFISDVPNIKGCDSWAHNEDDVISKTLELVMFYLKITDEKKIKVDKSRSAKAKEYYKLVIEKEF
jgi:hypothetical protein